MFLDFFFPCFAFELIFGSLTWHPFTFLVTHFNWNRSLIHFRFRKNHNNSMPINRSNKLIIINLFNFCISKIDRMTTIRHPATTESAYGIHKPFSFLFFFFHLVFRFFLSNYAFHWILLREILKYNAYACLSELAASIQQTLGTDVCMNCINVFFYRFIVR